MKKIANPRMDSLRDGIVGLGLHRPRMVILGSVIVTLLLGALIVRIQIDTDPENMLPGDDPVRVLNESMRDDFGTRPMIALGILDEDGVLIPETMTAAGVVIEEIGTV